MPLYVNSAQCWLIQPWRHVKRALSVGHVVDSEDPEARKAKGVRVAAEVETETRQFIRRIGVESKLSDKRGEKLLVSSTIGTGQLT